MMRLAESVVILAILTASPAATKPSSDGAAVIAVLHAACDAFERGDAARLEALLSPDFTLTDSSGIVTDRDANLEEVRKREPRYESFRNHDMKVRLYGDAAVVSGITSVKGTALGRPFEANFRFTDTLIRRRGTWTLAASHASRLSP